MMEKERMREVLATRGMGWTEFKHLHGSSDWTTHDGKGHHVVKMDVDRWHPDTDWAQCGLVIKAMRAKGWRMDVHDDMMCYYGRWTHMDGGESAMIYEPTFCKWVAVSAARALEATDDQP